MVSEGLHWLNEVVLRWFGAEGQAVFAARPWLYLVPALGMAAAAGGLAWWVVRRFRRFLAGWSLALSLLPSRDGIRCLRLARDIRGRCRSLRHILRREMEDRSERQAWLRRLERFTAHDLPLALEQARVFISQADDRAERRLRALLEEQTRGWAEAMESAGQEAQLESIARTRQQLAKVSQANRERERLVSGLEETADALRELEAELTGLRIARDPVLPELKSQLETLTRHLSHLKTAHRDLQRRE